MPRQTSGNRLEAAIKARDDLEKQIKELKDQERLRLKQEDERRCTVVGRSILALIDADPESTLVREIRAQLDKVVTRPADRTLFSFLDQSKARKGKRTATSEAVGEVSTAA